MPRCLMVARIHHVVSTCFYSYICVLIRILYVSSYSYYVCVLR
jgi:hypothetical protein